MIGKIKINQGSQFTFQMETMVKDLNTSEEEEGPLHSGTSFTEHFQSTFLKPKESRSEAWKGDEFIVKMLTAGDEAGRSWPLYMYHNPPDIIVPVCIQQAIDHHRQFYKSFDRHQSRKLVWSHLLGQMELAFKPKNKEYRITMSPMQAYVCLSFTSFDEKLTGVQLNEMLNLDGEKGSVARLSNTRKLKTALGSLMAKKNVVVCYNKEGKRTKKVKTDGSFSPNAKFKSDRRKFNMPKTKFDSKKVISKVKEDRTMHIDSCLVRMLFGGRTMHIEELIAESAESMDQLSFLFKVDKHTIKNRIYSLIDREYFRRDEEDPNPEPLGVRTVATYILYSLKVHIHDVHTVVN